MGLIAISLFGVLPPTAFAASTRALAASSQPTLVLIHGFNDTCDGAFKAPSESAGSSAFDYFVAHVWDVATIGYYGASVQNPYDSATDSNCTHDSTEKASKCTDPSLLEPQSSLPVQVTTINDPIEHLGCEVAWEIYDTYTSQGKTIDIVAHSMGGLVVRDAIGESGHNSIFPPALAVSRVVTVGTPHGGLSGAYINAAQLTTNCVEVQDMNSTSAFMAKMATAQFQAPQGASSTFWGLVASSNPKDALSLNDTSTYPWGDGVVQATSALDMSANAKVLYGSVLINDGAHPTPLTADTSTEYSHNAGVCRYLNLGVSCNIADTQNCEAGVQSSAFICLLSPFYLTDTRDFTSTRAWVCAVDCPASPFMQDMNVQGPPQAVPPALAEIDNLVGGVRVINVPSGGTFSDVWNANIAGLGQPITNFYERVVNGTPLLQEQDFQSGSIYFTPFLQTLEVQGAIFKSYSDHSGPGGFLSFPVSSERASGSGRVNYFNGTSCGNAVGSAIYWSAATNVAKEVHGCIFQRYFAMHESAWIGFPTSDEVDTLTSGNTLVAMNSFQNANVYWSAATGANEIQGAILADYLAHAGGPTGPLGTPATDEQVITGGRANFFKGTSCTLGAHQGNGGIILWQSGPNAYFVQGCIYQDYVAHGLEAGALGFPTSNEQSVSGGRDNTFAGTNCTSGAHQGSGSAIYWSSATEAAEIQGCIYQDYLAHNGPGGPLGLPTTDEQAWDFSGSRVNFFANGPSCGSFHDGAAILWSSATGAHQIQGCIYHDYLALLNQNVPVGLPTSDEIDAAGGAYNTLSGTSCNTSQFPSSSGAGIYWSPTTDTHEVQGCFYQAYLQQGGPGGALGFPTTDQVAVSGGWEINFLNGFMTFDSTSGQVNVTFTGPIVP